MENVLHAGMGGIRMSNAQWVKYTGSDEQIAEIDNCKNGLLAKNDLGYIWPDIYEHFNFAPIGSTHYLICATHPLADMICQWARTGQPVWYRFKATEFEPGIETEEPDWFNDELEFKLTPFED